MQVNLTYHHWSNEISVTFKLTSPDEVSFGFGIGASPEEAKQKFFGWFNKESEVNGKLYKMDNEQPYIYLYKKMRNGTTLAAGKAINILEDWPAAPGDAVTVRSYYW